MWFLQEPHGETFQKTPFFRPVLCNGYSNLFVESAKECGDQGGWSYNSTPPYVFMT
jgi:hypothetical protein